MSTTSPLAAAYGGSRWSPRPTTLRQEMDGLWGPWGIASESAPLQAVLLHRPGPEVEQVSDPDSAQMLARVDPQRLRSEHDALAEAYRRAGVAVHYLEPLTQPPPNTMFMRDLFFMTPEGAILARPASTVRAGEEVQVARRLAQLEVPILCSVRGSGTFEGADALWIDDDTVLLATGLRTNAEGARQVQALLEDMGVEVVRVDLPYGTMHLLGTLNFADRGLAVAWPARVPCRAVEALRARGYRMLWLPDKEEARHGMALNFVALGPRRILMTAGCPNTKRMYQSAAIECIEVEIDELVKAAGGIGCLTGLLRRGQP